MRFRWGERCEGDYNYLEEQEERHLRLAAGTAGVQGGANEADRQHLHRKSQTGSSEGRLGINKQDVRDSHSSSSNSPTCLHQETRVFAKC